MATTSTPSSAAGSYSTFLNLPAEVRNNVYEHIAERHKARRVMIVKTESTVDRLLLRADRKVRDIVEGRRSALKLRLTSRQLCGEVTPYIFGAVSYGLFLRGWDAKRYSEPHIAKQIDAFGTVFAPRLELITHLELGLDDVNLFLRGVIKSRPMIVTPTLPAPPTTFVDNIVEWVTGKPAIIPLDFKMGELLPILTQLRPSETLPNVRIITLHSSLPDAFTFRANSTSTPRPRCPAYRTSRIVNLLKGLFGALTDLRIMTGGRHPQTERYRLLDNGEKKGADSGFARGQFEEWYTGKFGYIYSMSAEMTSGERVKQFRKANVWFG